MGREDRIFCGYTDIVNLILPLVAPLITMLLRGNLLRECLCVDRWAETAANPLLNIVTLVVTVAIGATMKAAMLFDLAYLNYHCAQLDCRCVWNGIRCDGSTINE